MISGMRETIFTYGACVDSMLHIHNGNFRTCGQIEATRIVQGGPALSCLEECVYGMLVNPDVDITSLSQGKHFTEKDREHLNEIEENVTDHQDSIILQFRVVYPP